MPDINLDRASVCRAVLVRSTRALRILTITIIFLLSSEMASHEHALASDASSDWGDTPGQTSVEQAKSNEVKMFENELIGIVRSTVIDTMTMGRGVVVDAAVSFADFNLALIKAASDPSKANTEAVVNSGVHAGLALTGTALTAALALILPETALATAAVLASNFALGVATNYASTALSNLGKGSATH